MDKVCFVCGDVYPCCGEAADPLCGFGVCKEKLCTSSLRCNLLYDERTCHASLWARAAKLFDFNDSEELGFLMILVSV